VGKVRIIAEIGSNYDNDLEKAKLYIRAISECGADAVKFQTIRKDKLIAPKVQIDGIWQDNPVFLNFSNLELPDEWHHILNKTADEYEIEFISTPFYLEAVDLLESVGVLTYKIASGDITFTPLLEKIGGTGKQVILSTGASSLHEIEQALDILRQSGTSDIILLHTVSNYPPKWHEINLRAIPTLSNSFGLPVGISDHSPGSTVPIAAVALGAVVIEKHVTFDRLLPGPDHPFAMAVDEFGDMIQQIRSLEQAMGTGKKIPTEDEQAKQYRIRRGVYNATTYEPITEQSGLWLRPEHKSS